MIGEMISAAIYLESHTVEGVRRAGGEFPPGWSDDYRELEAHGRNAAGDRPEFSQIYLRNVRVVGTTTVNLPFIEITAASVVGILPDAS